MLVDRTNRKARKTVEKKDGNKFILQFQHVLPMSFNIQSDLLRSEVATKHLINMRLWFFILAHSLSRSLAHNFRFKMR